MSRGQVKPSSLLGGRHDRAGARATGPTRLEMLQTGIAGGREGLAGCGWLQAKHVELLIRFGKELRIARRMR